MAETFFYEYRKEFKVDTKIVRLFNTYGPYMDEHDGRVISNFFAKIKYNQPLEIYGDGTKTRSFCYVSDTIDGIIKMMNSDEKGPINIGNPYCEFKIIDLVKLLTKLTGKKLEVKYLDDTENDPKIRKPVIDKAMKRLKWKPKIELEEGLRRMYAHIKKTY